MTKTSFLGKDSGYTFCTVILVIFAVSFLALSIDELVLSKERLLEKEKEAAGSYVESMQREEEVLYDSL